MAASAHLRAARPVLLASRLSIAPASAQACSYMVGKMVWLNGRERAKKALGRRFDIRKFHDAGLLSVFIEPTEDLAAPVAVETRLCL